MNVKTMMAAVLGLGLVWATGCGKTDPTAPPKAEEKKDKKDDHGHGNGPHEGVVFDFGGGKYHGEFKPSHTKKDATVWILGADEKTPAPIKAEKLQLVRERDAGERESDAPVPLDSIAEPALAALMGLLVHDLLSMEMLGTLYAAFADAIPLDSVLA